MKNYYTILPRRADEGFAVVDNETEVFNGNIAMDNNGHVQTFTRRRDYDRYFKKVIATTSKFLDVPILPLAEKKTDKLILLERKDPIQYEIHRNEINQTQNLVLSTKDKAFAEKLVNTYNGKVTDEESILKIAKEDAQTKRWTGDYSGRWVEETDWAHYRGFVRGFKRSIEQNEVPKGVWLAAEQRCIGSRCSHHGYMHPDEPCEKTWFIKTTPNNEVIVIEWVY